jgi:hypothetical protein
LLDFFWPLGTAATITIAMIKRTAIITNIPKIASRIKITVYNYLTYDSKTCRDKKGYVSYGSDAT